MLVSMSNLYRVETKQPPRSCSRSRAGGWNWRCTCGVEWTSYSKSIKAHSKCMHMTKGPWHHGNYISPVFTVKFDRLSSVRYTWVLFGLCFSCPSYRLDLHNENKFVGTSSANPRWKHLQQLDWRSDLPWLSYGRRTCVFVDLLIRCVCPSSCVHHWV